MSSPCRLGLPSRCGLVSLQSTAPATTVGAVWGPLGSARRSVVGCKTSAVRAPLTTPPIDLLQHVPPLDHPTLPRPRPPLLVQDRHERRAKEQVIVAAGDEAVVGGGLPDASAHRLARAEADFVLAVLDLAPELARVRLGVLHIVAVAADLDNPKSQPSSLLTLGLDWTAISPSRSAFSRELTRPAPTPVASSTNVACQWWASARILP